LLEAKDADLSDACGPVFQQGADEAMSESRGSRQERGLPASAATAMEVKLVRTIASIREPLERHASQ
jgi:hypothetical protein